MIVVRPLSVLASTLGTSMNWKQRLFLGFLAPRGIVAAAVTSVFALEVIHSIDRGLLPATLTADAAKLVPLTFVVIIGTVTLYGLLAGPVARALGLAANRPQGVLFVGAEPWTVETAKLLREDGIEVLLIDRSSTNIARARMGGLPCMHADVLSRYVSEELELFGIGRLLAVTANFEVNTLACREFIHQFGRKNVYQLSLGESANQRTDLSHRAQGRTLFGERLTQQEIEHWIESGAQIKRTNLTDKFTYADFRARYGEQCVPLFELDAEGRLEVHTPDSPEPKPGAKLLCLISRLGLAAAAAATEPPQPEAESKPAV